MMRTYTLIFLLFCCYIAGFSQVKVTVGSPYGVVDAQQRYYFSKNGQILTVKLEDHNVMLQKLDAKTLAFLQIRTYNDLPKGIMVEKVMKFNDKFYLFYSLYENEKEQLFVREIDFESGTFRSVGRKIIGVEQMVSGQLVKSGPLRKKIIDKFGFHASFDSSLLMIEYSVVPAKKREDKNQGGIYVHVFDKDLNETWSNKITLPEEKEMSLLDYSLDRAGNVYITARVYEDNDTDRKKSKDVNIEIMKVAAKTGHITSSEVKIANLFLKTIRLSETRNNTMVGVGYYTKAQEPGSTDGLVYFKVNNNGQVSDLKTYEIPLEIINQYISEKDKRKNEKKEDDDEAELPYLSLSGVRIQEDGGILLIGEQVFVEHIRTSSNPSAHIYEVYCYHDMLVTRIDPNGKIMWMKKLPKRQQSNINGEVDPGSMSYFYISGKDDTHLLVYFDNVKNANLSTNEVPETHFDDLGGFLTAYKINDKTGDVKKITILDAHHVDNRLEIFQLRTSRIVNIAPNTLVLESYKKNKEDILIKAEFE